MSRRRRACCRSSAGATRTSSWSTGGRSGPCSASATAWRWTRRGTPSSSATRLALTASSACASQLRLASPSGSPPSQRRRSRLNRAGHSFARSCARGRVEASPVAGPETKGFSRPVQTYELVRIVAGCARLRASATPASARSRCLRPSGREFTWIPIYECSDIRPGTTKPRDRRARRVDCGRARRSLSRLSGRRCRSSAGTPSAPRRSQRRGFPQDLAAHWEES